MQPGEQLREHPLATQYGVSRATVRQAFGQLLQEGLLVAKKNCGVRAAPPPSETVRELLMPMRVMTEVTALKAVFGHITPTLLREWERILALLNDACQTGDYAAVVEYDFAFHRHLLVCGGLSDLLPLWTTIITKTHTFYKHRDLDVKQLPAVYLMHETLLRLFQDPNESAAVQALTEHIWNGAFNEQARRRWASQTRRTRH